MSVRSQPDGEETRDTLAAVGLFGFVLVPITAVATTIWSNRHPGLILRETEESGIDPDIRIVMILGALSFMILFSGLVALNYSIQHLKEEISGEKIIVDKEDLI